MTKIKDLLNAKKIKGILTISPDATVVDAVKMLAKHNIGALVVSEGDKPVGIISERDLIHKAQIGFCALDPKKVSEVMTRDVIIGVPEDDISYVMAIMIKSRIRHLPIVHDKKLVGMISIGDVVHAQISDEKYENKMLLDYIEGKYPG